MQETSSPQQQKKTVTLIAIIAVLFLAAIITGVILLAGAEAETTSRVRDIFIIILAFESLLIGAALVILVIQLAVLTNLIQNEVKPILDSTNETISTLRGTSQFIAKRAVAPIISVGSTMAGFRKLIQLIGFIRKK